MRTQVSVKTITVLEKPMIVDNTSGKEGELLLSHSGNTVGNINIDGELVIEPEGDDANKYEKEQENLTYNEG